MLSQCLEYLKMLGIFCWRNNVGCAKIGNRFMRFGLKGSSDILGIMPDGRFLAVECKREKGGKLSEEQSAFLDAIRSRGGLAICANSVHELECKILSQVKT